MAKQMIWLLGYVSLGFALTLGNRPNINTNQRGQVRLTRYEHRPRSTEGAIAGPASSSTVTTMLVKNKDSTGSGLDYRYGRYSRYGYGRESSPYDVPPDWITYNDRNDNDNDDDDDEDNVKENLWNFSESRHHTQPDNALSSHAIYNNVIMDDFADAVLETLYPHKQDLRKNNRDYMDKRINDLSVRDKARLAGTSYRENSIETSENALPVKLQNDVLMRENDRLIRDQNDLTIAASPLKRTLTWPDNSLGPLENPWKIHDNNDVRPHNEGTNIRRLEKRNHLPEGRRRSSTNSHQTQPQVLPSLPSAAIGGVASQFMLRAARGNRQYDVPQIECPSSEDGMERFACPTPDRMGRYRCIDDHVLCDGFIDCPTGEDEDRQACMFYKTTKAHLDVLADALLRWVRGR